MSQRPPSCLDEAAEWLRKRFDSDAAAGVRLVYGFQLTGPRGGALGVRIDHGRLEIAAGLPRSPDVTLRLAAEDLLAVLAGRENADLLFMAERLEVEGDLTLALRLRQIFRAPA